MDNENPPRLSRVEVVLRSAVEDNEEVGLRQLALTLWKQRWLLIATVALFAVASVVYALLIPNQYTATAILTPATASGASGLGRLAQQYGGLASLAGIDLSGAGEQDKSTLAVELAKTWSFQEAFIRKNHLEVAVFAARGWDRRTGELRIDSDLYDTAKRQWMPDPDSSTGGTREPSGWKLYSAFSKHVAIAKDSGTGTVTLSISHYSPALAKEWVDKLVGALNEHLREKDLEEARKNIAYLTKQTQSTSLTEMRTVFFKLIEEQTKNLMLAEVSDEYVLKTLSPAKVPEEKSGPPRSLICVGITVLGTFIGVILALLNAMRRKTLKKPY